MTHKGILYIKLSSTFLG